MKETPGGNELLTIFVVVADVHGYSKAAEKLGLSKSTVSRAITQLENLVGAELIHRTTHSMALSTAGIALYERVAPAIVALRHALAKLPERDVAPSGQLRITAPYDFGTQVLPELLAQFSMRHREVIFDVQLTDGRVDLVADGFDLAIRVSATRMKDSTLIARKLGVSVVGYYASPSYVARRGEPHGFGDPKHDWVVFPPLLSVTPLPKGVRPRFRISDFFVVRNLLREGAGVGPLPGFVAAPCLADGTLAQVLPLAHAGKGQYFLVYPSSGQVPRKVSAFRDFLLERIGSRPLL
jgi:DNA-binding transcriptional LysR family regulator